MEYEIGCKVKIKDDLKVGVLGVSPINQYMAEMAGEVHKIHKIIKGRRYVLEGSPWLWSEQMFEKGEMKNVR